MNQPRDTDPPRAWLSAGEAAAQLDVKATTLYAYVSRGRIRSRPVPGTRRREYLRADVDRLRARRDARAGHSAVAAGALRWGEPVLDSAITEIQAAGPIYRGHAAATLATTQPYEAVAELLWTGALAGNAPAWPSPRGLGVLRRGARALPVGARPLDLLACALTLGATTDPGRLHRGPAELDSARRIVRLLAAAPAIRGEADSLRRVLRAPSVAEVLLAALGRPGRESDLRLLEQALILSADHELNPSSFVARVTASVRADLYACVSAALATLSGPRHGAMSDSVEALVREIARPEHAARVIESRLQRGDGVPGFGHPLYPDGDPRGVVLLDAAEAHAPRNRVVRTLRAAVDCMRLAGAQGPTLDVGLVAVRAVLRLDEGTAPVLFAVGRSAGWIAHALEQRAAGFLLRPRARYVGVREA